MFIQNGFLRWLATGETPAFDESLYEHDRRFHPEGFREGDSCGVRDALAVRDGSDAIPTGDPATAVSVKSVGNYYGDPGIRELAHGIKDGDGDAIAKAAGRMAAFVEPGSVLVPMPGRSGRATNTAVLADRIAGLVDGAEMIDALESDGHESLYDIKKRGERPSEFKMRLVRRIGGGRKVYIVDNVYDTGTTARSALNALPGAEVLVLGRTGGARNWQNGA